MDTNPLKPEFFTMSEDPDQDQRLDPAVAKANAGTEMWEAEGMGAQLALSGATSTGPATSLTSLTQTSTAPTYLSYGSVSDPSQYSQGAGAEQARPGLAAGGTVTKRTGTNERKRAKLDPEAEALESVDYWIQFDDAENEKAGSFEIDFSKRRNDDSSIFRAPSTFRTIAATPRLGTGLYTSASGVKSKQDDFIDDSALDNALSEDEDFMDSINLDDQLSKIDTAPPAEVPPREGLYSTPLSWERPQPGLRMDPLPNFGTVPVLSEAEQRRLLAIALNTGKTAPSYGAFPFGYGTGMMPVYPFGLGSGSALHDPDVDTTSPSQLTKTREKARPPSKSQEAKPVPAKETKERPPAPAPKLPQRSNTGASEKGKEKMKPPDRTTHNDIERKYRTNLKDKIAELRNAVPALRAIPEDGEEEEDEEEGQQQRAPKVSKGTVLTKATEYIHMLERRNKALLREHQELSRRLQAFEQLLNAAALQPFSIPNYSRTLFDPRGFC